MAASRHKLSRSAGWRRNISRVALPATGFVALSVAATAVVIADPVQHLEAAEPQLAAAALPEEIVSVSRSAERPALEELQPEVTGSMWVVADTDVLADAAGGSAVLASVSAGEKVGVTDTTEGDWTQIVHNDLPRWVATSALSAKEPLGTEPCAIGSGVERGLRPDTIKVYRAVCAKFPQVVRYGGVAGRGEHATGHALDIMVRGPLGDEIAAFLQANRAELGIEYLIWKQRIWRPATSPSWRGMSNRGSATANHMDHVHVTTYGSAATQ